MYRYSTHRNNAQDAHFNILKSEGCNGDDLWESRETASEVYSHTTHRFKSKRVAE